MHLLVRETHALDEAEPAVDLDQSPADLLLLSFSDSDLGAAAAAWQAMGDAAPSLRLASLARLRHPMSVDLWLEKTAAHARGIVVRLLGGLEYWRYGAEELAALCRRAGIALALLPGDAREDARLAEMSTVPPALWVWLHACFREGGPDNLRAALHIAAHAAGLCPDAGWRAEALPQFGEYRLDAAPDKGGDLTVIVFYRSLLLAGDTAPVDALAAALAARGLAVRALHVASLKERDAADFVAQRLAAWRPAAVLNATFFSARGEAGSPLDAAGAPVLQLVLSGSSRAAWAASARGLSQADLAMQVVLPEFDGRLLTGAISFKAAQEAVPGLEFARTLHHPDEEGIALAADRAAGWARLAATPRGKRRLGIVLSDYPGAPGQVAQAVGLDGFASLHAVLTALRDAGYDTEPDVPDAASLARLLAEAAPLPLLSVAAYRQLAAGLPDAVRTRLHEAWGAPEDDPAQHGGWFTLRHLRLGHILAAVQPDRGAADRKAGYHDPDLPPRHAYVAFHLWLRDVERLHALVHLGAHGTLEWLPGKAAALSAACFPAALLRGLPVVYPFIVNNPGEAAVAKRRLGAVTIGHLTPPLRTAGLYGAAAALERLIDEYAAADGLDRRRTARLRRDILARAEAAGLAAEAGLRGDMDDADALARLDAWLCDVKEMQIRDGLHVFGVPPPPPRRAALLDALRVASPGADAAQLEAALDACAARERASLLDALDGRFVPPGPAGAPTRGRADVLPTGRNLATLDPRAVPARSAVALAERAAEDLLRRHLQEQGMYPRSLVLDLWGSATMRTGGEELALALVLMGAHPVWDEGSSRVSGIEVLPLAVLGRPRVDVSLRVSGLFRDAFPQQIALFDSAVQAIAARGESAEDNPLAASLRGLDGAARRLAAIRVHGAAPGAYGAGAGAALDRMEGRAAAGAAYLAASSFGYGQGMEGVADEAGFAARVAAADAFVHPQDHAEADLLDGNEVAAHAGGFAAAASALGASPALWHLDTSRPDAPRARGMAEEVARVVRARAANPAWIAGMMRHGYRGAAEIARAVQALHGFAATLPQRLDASFDLLFDATLGDAEVDRFLRTANAAAREDMRARFDDALCRGLWRPRRNAVAATLAERDL